jgi:hypothetical protein
MRNLLVRDGSRHTLPIGSADQVNWLLNMYKVINFFKTVFFQNIKHDNRAQNIKHDNRANIFLFYFSFTGVRNDAF